MVNGRVHPYIPNSEKSVKQEMLKELGMKSAEDIFEAIPEHLRFRGKMNLPEPHSLGSPATTTCRTDAC